MLGSLSGRLDTVKLDCLRYAVKATIGGGFSTQLPFAEVLGSELLLMRFSFSPFRGVVLARFFFPRLLDFGFQNGAKDCIVLHCVDLGESLFLNLLSK